jgi:RNA polymerase sigma factor (sigma-70 family)
MEGSHHERRQQFEKNFDKHNSQLKRYILRNVHNEADAEELAAQTLFRFFEFMEGRQWEEEIGSVTAYLYGIAKHDCARFMSRRHKETTLDSDDEEEGAQTRRIMEKKAMQENNPTSRIEKEIYYEELYHRLPAIIFHDVTEDEFKLFCMHHVEQMNAAEIAAELGKDPELIGYKLNKLSAKIRYRARQSGAVEWLS